MRYRHQTGQMDHVLRALTALLLALGTLAASVVPAMAETGSPPTATYNFARTGEDYPVVVAVLANDTDPDGDILSVASVDTRVTVGSVTINSDQTVTYTPAASHQALAAGAYALDSFRYTASDGIHRSKSGFVRIRVYGANDRPLAVRDDADSGEDDQVVIPVLANDSDIDTDDTLSIANIDITLTTGSVTLNDDGTLTYATAGKFESLAAGAVGQDRLWYQVRDTGGKTKRAFVKVQVIGVNDAPVATDDAGSAFTSSLTIDVLANDTDVDTGDTLSVTSLDSTGTSGSVSIAVDGTVSYTPEAGFSGPDTFSYTVEDGHGGSDTAAVVVTVETDQDGDTVFDSTDNCPAIANADQTDTDEDAVGNACDSDDDNDGLSDEDEVRYGTDPIDADSDDDGLSDGAEVNTHRTNPNDDDSDHDGLNDGEEVNTYSTDPNDDDSDHEGLYDGEEVNRYRTNPNDRDTDDDGLADSEEVGYNGTGTDPNDADSDNDRIDDGWEAYFETDPNNADCDDDGLVDGDEVYTYLTDPNDDDTDGDGLSDGDEVDRWTDPNETDTDGDGLSDGDEVNTHGTDPRDEDTDDDGAWDDVEIRVYFTDPTDADSDDDGLEDGYEIGMHHTDPLDADSDDDGFNDEAEISAGTDPNDASSYPLT